MVRKDLAILIFVLSSIIGWVAHAYFNLCREIPKESVTTIVKRDTVKVEVPVPVHRGVVKKETIRPRKITNEVKIQEADVPAITQDGEIEIPIERKIYQGEDFKAVIEGWQPNLVDMEVYPKNIIQTKLKSPRFSITVGPGIGWDGKEIRPYLGVTAGLVVFSR